MLGLLGNKALALAELVKILRDNGADEDLVGQAVQAAAGTVDWEQVLQEVLTDLPQIIADVAAIVSLFQ